MNLLEKEFVCNSDKRGDNKFVQVKRNEYAAMYRRYDMDGKALEFEVFQVKVAGGNEIFGRHYDEYEQYPGASTFGRTAWTTLDADRAEEIYNSITAGKGSRKDGEAIEEPKVVKVRNVGGKRGRKAVVRPAVVFPKKKFSMGDLFKLNVDGWTKPTLYLELNKQVKLNKVQVVGTKPNSSGRGKPLVIYQFKG